MSKLEKAKEIVNKYYNSLPYGIFNTRNTVGDKMTTLYSKDGLTVDACFDWGYFEIFGLTSKEFKSLRKFYYDL